MPRPFPSPCGEMIEKETKTARVHVRVYFKFPSPCGEMIEKEYSRRVPARGARFHPLAGKWLKKYGVGKPHHPPAIRCFHPLAGKWLKKTNFRRKSKIQKERSFPSPCGEMIEKEVGFLYPTPISFPSPCGEMIEKADADLEEKRSCGERSFHPLAGKWLKKSCSLNIQDMFYVSIPLRGNDWKSSLQTLVTSVEGWKLFPSPCGEMIEKGAYANASAERQILRFHPLAGKWLKKSKGSGQFKVLWWAWFPSPCGEMIEKGRTKRACPRSPYTRSFHPLAGKWLKKIYLIRNRESGENRVSIPLRGNDWKRRFRDK